MNNEQDRADKLKEKIESEYGDMVLAAYLHLNPYNKKGGVVVMPNEEILGDLQTDQKAKVAGFSALLYLTTALLGAVKTQAKELGYGPDKVGRMMADLDRGVTTIQTQTADDIVQNGLNS